MFILYIENSSLGDQYLNYSLSPPLIPAPPSPSLQVTISKKGIPRSLNTLRTETTAQTVNVKSCLLQMHKAKNSGLLRTDLKTHVRSRIIYPLYKNLFFFSNHFVAKRNKRT